MVFLLKALSALELGRTDWPQLRCLFISQVLELTECAATPSFNSLCRPGLHSASPVLGLKCVATPSSLYFEIRFQYGPSYLLNHYLDQTDLHIYRESCLPNAGIKDLFEER